MVNIASAPWSWANESPRRIAVRGAGVEWSYAHLWQLTVAYAEGLRREGVNLDDHVLLIAPSTPEFVVAYLALQAIGAVAVTINTASTEREIEHVIADADCCLIIAWHQSSSAATVAAARHGVPCIVLPGGATAVSGGLADLGEGPVARGADDTAVILYTSGTTGRPKGAQLTHGNLDTCAAVFEGLMEITPEDRMGTALPLFHVFGQAVIMGCAMRTGASLSLLARFTASAMIDMVRHDRLTVVAGVPTMWNAMLQAPGAYGTSDFESLRLAGSGGAPLPADVIHAFGERFGCVILEGYGLTETTGIATFNGLHRRRKAGAVGIPIPGFAVELRDDSGNNVESGEVGEIYISGPGVMKGYWNQPEATAEVLKDGWLRTGDMAIVDSDGDVHIVGRKKELILVGGYNVYPGEVEEVLYEHVDVLEAVVVGVPDAYYGEQVCVVAVVRSATEAFAKQLHGWLGRRLSRYKVPTMYEFVNDLPKGATGKIIRRRAAPDATRVRWAAPRGPQAGRAP